MALAEKNGSDDYPKSPTFAPGGLKSEHQVHEIVLDCHGCQLSYRHQVATAQGDRQQRHRDPRSGEEAGALPPSSHRAMGRDASRECITRQRFPTPLPINSSDAKWWKEHDVDGDVDGLEKPRKPRCIHAIRAKSIGRLNFSFCSPLKPMSKLTTLKKKIAALEVQAERIAKAEMSSAISKVQDIMSEFNLTVEHLTQTVVGKRAAKKTKAKKVSVAKYADPKTGKTWSGFGRAPGWIAGAKNRDAFLVSVTTAAEPAAKLSKVAKKTVKQPAKKAAPAAKKASVVKATAPVAAKKKPAPKRASVKKSAPKRAASKRGAPMPVVPIATPTA